MLPVLNKVFVRRFYSANGGFFFFFFFLFFGAVQSESLLSYHLSLMESLLESGTVLLLVVFCWILYHLKCTTFFFRVLDSAEGNFLISLQALPALRLWLTCLVLHTAVYAPVLVYATVVFWVGINKGYSLNTIYVLLFQVVSTGVFSSMLYYRLTHWQNRFAFPAFRLPFQKHSLLFLFFYFTGKRKLLLLVLKTVSVLLLYIVLVWNKGRYDPDAFLVFYLVLLLAHSTLPYLAVAFFEKEFAVFRNIPVSLFTRGLSFLLPYCLLMLPEALYLFYAGTVLPATHVLAYWVNTIAFLSLLTAVQYNDAKNRDAYLKAVFAVFFISIFVLHVQAFWFWVTVQFCIAIVLFSSGYNRYERSEGPETDSTKKTKQGLA